VKSLFDMTKYKFQII